jgi:hypothetical protein
MKKTKAEPNDGDASLVRALCEGPHASISSPPGNQKHQLLDIAQVGSVAKTATTLEPPPESSRTLLKVPYAGFEPF